MAPKRHRRVGEREDQKASHPSKKKRQTEGGRLGQGQQEQNKKASSRPPKGLAQRPIANIATTRWQYCKNASALALPASRTLLDPPASSWSVSCEKRRSWRRAMGWTAGLTKQYRLSIFVALRLCVLVPLISSVASHSIIAARMELYLSSCRTSSSKYSTTRHAVSYFSSEFVACDPKRMGGTISA